MKVILAEHYGVCFGVRDAIAQAEQLADAGPVTILGELVHNPIVRERLAARGAEEAPLDRPGGSATAQVMITAHGASDAAREAWRQAGFAVADGTCPLVRYAHEQLKRLVTEGFHPVIIGSRGHVEVEGLRGDFPDAFVFEEEEQLRELPVAGRYGVISQTTQPILKARRLVEALRAARPGAEVRFRDTVCQPTKSRQTALQKLLGEADTLVVVGGRRSNNTLQLAEAGRAAGKRVFHVQHAGELSEEIFSGAETIGVTAGTSTLRETVTEVVQRLEEWTPA